MAVAGELQAAVFSFLAVGSDVGYCVGVGVGLVTPAGNIAAEVLIRTVVIRIVRNGVILGCHHELYEEPELICYCVSSLWLLNFGQKRDEDRAEVVRVFIDDETCSKPGTWCT